MLVELTTGRKEMNYNHIEELVNNYKNEYNKNFEILSDEECGVLSLWRRLYE